MVFTCTLRKNKQNILYFWISLQNSFESVASSSGPTMENVFISKDVYSTNHIADILHYNACKYTVS